MFESRISSEDRRTDVVYEVCESCGCDLWSDFEVSASLCVDCFELADPFTIELLAPQHAHTWGYSPESGHFDAHGFPCAQCVTCGEFRSLRY